MLESRVPLGFLRMTYLVPLDGEKRKRWVSNFWKKTNGGRNPYLASVRKYVGFDYMDA